MAATTGIEWCDATFNWWSGCTKVSAACDNCYAEAWAERFGVVEWGSGKPRRSRLQQCGLDAFKLHQQAMRGGWRPKVFSNSVSDFFDKEVPDEWRDYAMARILVTQRLDWLLLTKRHKVMADYMAALYAGERDLVATFEPPLRARVGPFVEQAMAEAPWPNLWLGVTAENQAAWDQRVEALGRTPAVRRFVSCEPLLGEIDVGNAFDTAVPDGTPYGVVHWVIAGGESGPKARPTHPDHVRFLRDQCAAWEVPFFFKQWGQWRPGVFAKPDKKGPFAYYLPARRPGSEWIFPGFALGADLAGEATAQMTRCQMKKQAGALLDGRKVQQFPAPLLPAGGIEQGRLM